MARSFRRLRAYYKVGGVLVGREPDEVAKGLDLVGIDFAFDEMGAGLTIHSTHSDGTKTTVGPYDPAVAHLALAYAADGRPVTVTIVPAPPLADRKILLHPALVDTEVGCHAIRLDQFVDRFGWNRAKELDGHALIDADSCIQTACDTLTVIVMRERKQRNFNELGASYPFVPYTTTRAGWDRARQP